MAEHTPGPWTVGKRRLEVIAPLPDDARIGAMLITRVERYYTGPGKGQEIANARLIAAAPSLLAACELALHDFEGIRGALIVQTREVLRAAISRARGEEE